MRRTGAEEELLTLARAVRREDEGHERLGLGLELGLGLGLGLGTGSGLGHWARVRPRLRLRVRARVRARVEDERHERLGLSGGGVVQVTHEGGGGGLEVRDEGGLASRRVERVVPRERVSYRVRYYHARQVSD